MQKKFSFKKTKENNKMDAELAYSNIESTVLKIF